MTPSKPSSKNVIPLKKSANTDAKKITKAAKKNPEKKKKQQLKVQNRVLIKAAADITKKTKASALFIYADALENVDLLDKISDDIKVILVTKSSEKNFIGAQKIKNVIHLPKLKMGRLGILKVAVLFALSAKMVKPQDQIVFLIGKAELNRLDTVINLNINEESELLTGHSIADLPSKVESAVFEQVLNIAIEIGNKGKEGKPVGTIFVIGDEEKVMQLSKQMIINPFRGYDAEERNLLNPILKETIREFSTLDGAFVVAGNGEVITAGRYLGAATEDSEIPRGLGSRHIAAAGITALTNAIAVVISESTGDVRIFKNGNVIMSLDKANYH